MYSTRGPRWRRAVPALTLVPSTRRSGRNSSTARRIPVSGSSARRMWVAARWPRASPSRSISEVMSRARWPVGGRPGAGETTWTPVIWTPWGAMAKASSAARWEAPVPFTGTRMWPGRQSSSVVTPRTRTVGQGASLTSSSITDPNRLSPDGSTVGVPNIIRS